MKNFTNLYSLSKTLRFELKPIGKNGEQLKQTEASEIFKKIIEQDNKVREAYKVLKLIMDKIHEEVINESLNSDQARQIDFSDYFEKYKNKEHKSLEKDLRKKIAETYEIGAEYIKGKAGKVLDKKGKIKIDKKTGEEKSVFKKKGIECLTEDGILDYIQNHLQEFISENLKENDLRQHLKTFEGFFTYFKGYNENRSNYYEYKEEKATAIATRIVHDNLPKFCDNSIQFSKRKADYLEAYQFLQDNHRSTQIKDAQTNTFINAYPIEEKMFDIAQFSHYLSQLAIEEYNKTIGHYNLLINLYNQSKQNENNFKKLEPFKPLYKQIGCGKKRQLFYALEYDTKEEQNADGKSNEVILNLESLLQFVNKAGEKYFRKSEDTNLITIYYFIDFLKSLKNWEGIYWSKSAVDKISNQYFANWHSITDRIKEGLENKNQIKDLKSVATYDKKREEPIKINDAVELSGLFKIIDAEQDQNSSNWHEIFFKASVLENKKDLIDENLPPSQNLIHLICADMKSWVEAFCNQSSDVLKIMDYKNEDNILTIKEWLDTAKSICWILKYFEVKESKVKGNAIHPELTNILDTILRADDANWFGTYDVVRDYLTKKSQEDAKENKLKLNFGSSSFLNGWDPEWGTHAGLLFEKSNRYYMGVLPKRLDESEIKYLRNIEYSDTKKIVLDFQKPDNKNTPRLFIRSKEENFAPAVLKYNLPINDIIDIYDKEKFKTAHKKINEKEYFESLHKLIDYFKLGFKKHECYAHYNFNWKVTQDYYSIDTFYHDTETSCYQIKFEAINWEHLLEFINQGKLYLFEIYSKDFSDKKGEESKNSKLNLQTQYWQHIFDQDSTIQLCGGGEIFWREPVQNIKKEPTHKIGEKMINRKEKNTSQTIPNHIYYELYQFANGKITLEKLSTETKNNYLINNQIDATKVTIKEVKHDIIKDKRFTTEKFFFHIPIKINYQADKSNLNEKVNENFTQTQDIQFLGIDRGEKHLIYYSLLDAKGTIIEQNHLDVINQKDYLQEINQAAKQRKEKQENWQQKGNIKNLKDGYISLAIHQIIQKMKGKDGQFKPTFIVLEDLNTGFKQSRQKFEQQVYQKFELALAKKLNYLVDKNAKTGEFGSISKALQLTPPVGNYQDIENKKQVGIILYTRANYTSVTDPATGWRKTIYLKKAADGKIKEQILESFSEIGIDNGDYFFEYQDKKTQKTWRLYSSKNGKSLDRYRSKRAKDKNDFIIESFNINEMLDGLFKNFNKQESLREQIIRGEVDVFKINKENSAWESLRFILDLIQQMRNSGDLNKKQDDNFLLSPVRNEQGDHFDSRIYEKQENPKLPKDADANGAYNIARKGMLMYAHIQQWIKDGKQKGDLDLFIADQEWDLFLSDSKQWEEKLPEFSSKKAKELLTTNKKSKPQNA